MAEDLDLEFLAWFEEATRKVQGGQQHEDSDEIEVIEKEDK